MIFSDDRNHASLIDGCRLSRATIEVYRHNDVDDLRRRMAARSGRRRFVVTESLFSMDGDPAPLEEIVAVAHAGEAAVIVDDAHALGVLGEGGAGLAPSSQADVIVGTLGKSVGSAGAFVAGSVGLADLLWNRARPLVFSTGMTIGAQAAALAGVEIARRRGRSRRIDCARARRLLGPRDPSSDRRGRHRTFARDPQRDPLIRAGSCVGRGASPIRSLSGRWVRGSGD